ncbi:MAG: hypothetical protein NT040_05400 [Bacteroidetes bacterium]|nr:hypothetical protein [Bacteroidota bacterium]
MRIILLSVCVLICIASCKKHRDVQSSPQVHEFKGIVVTDDQGDVMGTWGTDDGDWETDSTWTPGEYALLNFADTVSLNGTYVRDTSGWNIGPGIHEQPQNIVAVFPNPAVNEQNLFYIGLGMVKFKVAIVDKYYNRLFAYACKNGSKTIRLDLSDSTKFQNGTIYRIYYSLSATDSLNYYKGHGDILICRGSTLQDCRKYVP